MPPDRITAPVPLHLGVDVGSTSTKAIVFTADGAPVASVSAGYDISRPAPDHAEQDATSWTRAVDTCLAEVAAGVDLATVVSIGITSQVDTHVPVDAGFRPLRPALLWQDVRAATEAADLNARLGEDGRRAGWGGPSPIDASNPVPRALWLARHEPAVWEQTRWLLLPKDYLNATLTGVAGADAWGSFKVVGADGAYVPGVAHAPGLAERLAPLTGPEAEVGRLLRDWHGIPAGTVVAAGTMDGLGNVLGSGLSAPGDTMAVIGTSVIVGAVGVGGTTGPGVINFAPYRGRQVHAGPTQAGGDSLRWWARLTGHTVEEVLVAAAAARPGAGGVVFAPHLLGERAPLWDDDVRAWFIGLSAATGYDEMSRAVVEGVAHSLRQLLEAVDVASTVPATSLRLSGGGSRSELWCQVVADVTGRTVHRSREADTAVVGAATLGAAAVTGRDPWEASVALAQTDRTFTPDPGDTPVLDAMHAIYRDSYLALTDVHAALTLARTPRITDPQETS